jgi:geranylgeranyl diphosphate synthase type II
VLAGDRSVDPYETFVRDVEASLSDALDRVFAPNEGPPRLREAARAAVLGGGSRVRPSLCTAVAEAYGNPMPELTRSYAVAVELAHAASLVHDDLPTFDDAATRRGRPSVHAEFGEATAILVGDALIVAAFDTLGGTAATAGGKLGVAIGLLARALGGTHGLVAGQAWESEPHVDVDRYHRAKTAALFEASASLGALAAGSDAGAFRAFGENIGLAYQAADDLLDATGQCANGSAAGAGKPLGNDAAHGRPNLAIAVGESFARARIARGLEAAKASIPSSADPAPLVGWLERLGEKLGAP